MKNENKKKKGCGGCLFTIIKLFISLAILGAAGMYFLEHYGDVETLNRITNRNVSDVSTDLQTDSVETAPDETENTTESQMLEIQTEALIAEEAVSQDTIRADVKEAIDSYEAFMTEYCEFMTKYDSDSSNAVGLLVEYAEYMSKYADMVEKFDALEDDLTDAEYVYYVEVQSRVLVMLAKVSTELD